jgi:phosphatidate cytidylyltransferase
MRRELAAAVAIPIVLAILFVGPPLLFNLLVAVVALCALWEFYRLAEKSGHRVAKTLGLAASGLVLGAAALRWGPIHFETSGGTVEVIGRSSLAWWYGAALVFVFAASIAPLLGHLEPSAALSCASATVFGVGAVALPATSLCFLRAHSPRAVLSLLLVVWVCDSCAYYVGRRFGKTPLAPVVSPKKTWEGTFGGLIGATLFGAAAGTWWFLPQLGPARGALAGALASSAGQVGDLVESLWKRGAGVKDSGRFLPGHGGFYDRIDSLLFAGPVMAAFVLGIQP